jgi:hypothetical protein
MNRNDKKRGELREMSPLTSVLLRAIVTSDNTLAVSYACYQLVP